MASSVDKARRRDLRQSRVKQSPCQKKLIYPQAVEFVDWLAIEHTDELLLREQVTMAQPAKASF